MTGETVAVRANADFDAERLTDWLYAHVPGFKGPLSVSQFAGGQSNPTFLLETPSRRYVMRRKPAGPVLKGAHAVDREARVITAVEKLGYPVPHIHALCTDGNVIGSWFYIMDHVEGRIFWNGTFGSMAQHQRDRYMLAMNEVQSRLHTLDPVAAWLEDFGSTRNYFRGRQRYGPDSTARTKRRDAMQTWTSSRTGSTRSPLLRRNAG